jgi:hypothetical protein
MFVVTQEVFSVTAGKCLKILALIRANAEVVLFTRTNKPLAISCGREAAKVKRKCDVVQPDGCPACKCLLPYIGSAVTGKSPPRLAL